MSKPTVAYVCWKTILAIKINEGLRMVGRRVAPKEVHAPEIQEPLSVSSPQPGIRAVQGIQAAKQPTSLWRLSRITE